jgi:hypothetical protein
MYSGEYDACDVTLSVFPHRASLKHMPDHGGNRTYDLCNTSPMHSFQACPVWVYTQSNITIVKLGSLSPVLIWNHCWNNSQVAYYGRNVNVQVGHMHSCRSKTWCAIERTWLHASPITTYAKLIDTCRISWLAMKWMNTALCKMDYRVIPWWLVLHSEQNYQSNFDLV